MRASALCGLASGCILIAVSCSGSEFEARPGDSGISADAQGGTTADAAETCLNDSECAASGRVCDPLDRRCTDPCQNSLDCATDRVCDEASGHCVECTEDADCETRG